MNLVKQVLTFGGYEYYIDENGIEYYYDENTGPGPFVVVNKEEYEKHLCETLKTDGWIINKETGDINPNSFIPLTFMAYVQDSQK